MPDETVHFNDEAPESPDELAPTEADVKLVRKRSPRTAKAALSMALAGASNADIAQQLGYATPAVARAAWEEELGKAYDHEEDYAAFRRLQSGRMNRLLQAVAPRAFSSTVKIPNPKDPTATIEVANDRQLEFIREYRATVESISKLHGLNAPQVLAMVTPSQAEFEKVVHMASEAITGGKSVEGDIFGEDVVDAEVVDE